MTEIIEGSEFVGWVVFRDGREPRLNGDGILFADYAEAQAARRLLDVIAPITQARLEELRRQFDRAG